MGYDERRAIVAARSPRQFVEASLRFFRGVFAQVCACPSPRLHRTRRLSPRRSRHRSALAVNAPATAAFVATALAVVARATDTRAASALADTTTLS